MGAGGKATGATMGYILWLFPGIIWPSHRQYFKKPWVLRALTFNYFFIGWFMDLFMIPAWAIEKDQSSTMRKAELKRAQDTLNS